MQSIFATRLHSSAFSPEYSSDITLIIHTAGQPSHDWAAREPQTDFTVNANGTLNLLEAARFHCPDAVFIFTSTNKVYGDHPNQLPLVESVNRWSIDFAHEYANGISDHADRCVYAFDHAGMSKVAADLMVQEYGRYFGMKTVCFRGGCFDGAGAFRRGVARLSCVFDEVLRHWP